MAQIIGLFTAGAEKRLKRDWSNQDLAELYRVESALAQAGIHIETERGTSDEGDPWFVFCHSDSGDVIVHFARIDGRYVIAAPILARPLKGPDLTTIVRRFVTDNPLSIPSSNTTLQGNVILHPAALLTIFVATVLILGEPSEGIAAGLDQDGFDDGGFDDGADGSHSTPGDMDLFSIALDADDHPRIGEKTLLLIAVAMAVEVVKFHDLGGDHAGLVFGFDEDQFASLAPEHDQFAEQDFFIDLYASAETMSAHAAPVVSDDHWSEDSTQPQTSHLEVPVDDKSAFRDVPVASEVHEQSSEHFAANVSTAHSTSVERPALQLVSEHVNVEIPVQSEPSSGGAAHAWFENQVASQGWSVTVLDQDHSIAVQVAELVGDRIGLQDGDERDPSGGASQDVAGLPQVASIYQAIDPSAQHAVDYFRASDNDIAVIDQPGFVVLFDRSDFAAGEDLASHIWVFDDQTTMVILGRASTVLDALGVSA